MRKDIIIDISTSKFIENDIKHEMFSSINEADTSSSQSMSSNNMYFDIKTENTQKNILDGVLIELPYVPSSKNMVVRFFLKDGSLLKNNINGGEWFEVYFNSNRLSVAQANLVSSDSIFKLVVEDGVAKIYGGDSFDFEIGDSVDQDASLLIKLKPSSLSSHPISGVGIDDIKNGNTDKYDISEKILSELRGDRIIVNKIDTRNVDKYGIVLSVDVESEY